MAFNTMATRINLSYAIHLLFASERRNCSKPRIDTEDYEKHFHAEDNIFCVFGMICCIELAPFGGQ
jgi:20S proteasome alpha/beta subunit